MHTMLSNRLDWITLSGKISELGAGQFAAGACYTLRRQFCRGILNGNLWRRKLACSRSETGLKNGLKNDNHFPNRRGAGLEFCY